MITFLAFMIIGIILFLFYALLWSEKFSSERRKYHEYDSIFNHIYRALIRNESILIYSGFNCTV